MRIANLTGHDINIVLPGSHTPIKTIKPTKGEERLQAESEQTTLFMFDGVRYNRARYKLNLPKSELDRLSYEYDALIVSSISAKALRALGYTGMLFTIGRKQYDYAKRLIGVSELSMVQ